MNSKAKSILLIILTGNLFACQQEDNAQIASDYYSNGNYSAAELEYKKAVKKNPQDYQSYNMIGLLNLGVDDYNAMKYIDSSLAINNSYEYAYVNKGIIKIKQNKHKDAIGFLSKAISLDSNFTEAYFNRGIAHESIGGNISAINDFNKVILLNPNDYAPYYHLGKIYISINEIDRGCNYLNKSLSIEPTQEAINMQNQYCQNRKSL